MTADDPRPSFETRQALAHELCMTPRSVQIWFQNRRQRLLKPGEGGELSPTGFAYEPGFGNSAMVQGGERSPTARPPSNEGVPLGKPLIKPKKVDTPIILPSQLPPPVPSAAAAQPPPAPFQAQQQNVNPLLPPQTMPPPVLGGPTGAGPPGAHPYPVTAAHLVHAFAPLLRAEQHRAEQQQEQQRQAHRHAPPHELAQPTQPQQSQQQPRPEVGLDGIVSVPLNVAARLPSEDPSLPDSVALPVHPPPHHADAAVHATAADGPSVAAGMGSGGPSATLPLLMSRLGGLMAMCGSNSGSDPAVAISQALAMLPQAVAAGQLSPGAAALLMQALQQQVNAVVGGGWAPTAAGGHGGRCSGFGAHGADAQPFAPQGSLASSGAPVASPPASRLSSGDHPSSPRQPLPSHLGGPPDAWHVPSQMPPTAPHTASRLSAGTPAATAPVAAAAACAPSEQAAPVAAAGGPAETAASSVDALLLLSACADMQRGSSSSRGEGSGSDTRPAMGASAAAPLG